MKLELSEEAGILWKSWSSLRKLELSGRAESLWEGWSSLDELELSGGARVLEDMELSEGNGIHSKNSSSLGEL